ncbi:MAG: alpha/beta hydrolase [Alphaproteobacteria bacterium]|nr:alpha/beta hydrolase [Alphaproteobacteria bacterium]
MNSSDTPWQPGAASSPGTTITLEGIHGNRIAADTWGDPAGSAVIFLHGGGQTRHAWGGTAARIAATGRYAISVDLRGHGDSDWTATYHRTDFGRDVIEIVRQIGGAPMLVGASLGGISALFAEDLFDGTLCSALVLVDIAPNTNPAGVERILNFMRDGAGGFASLEEAADAVAGYVRERTRPQNVSGLRKNLRLKNDGRWYWHWDPRFLEHTMENRERDFKHLEDAASRLAVPTLLVRGGQSDVLTQDGIDAFRVLVPHAEFADIEGAGHMVAGDKNDAFTDAILRFAAKA